MRKTVPEKGITSYIIPELPEKPELILSHLSQPGILFPTATSLSTGQTENRLCLKKKRLSIKKH